MFTSLPTAMLALLLATSTNALPQMKTVVVMSTVTVVPTPASTPSTPSTSFPTMIVNGGYLGIGTGSAIPSGIFYPGHASASSGFRSGTGTHGPSPTGFPGASGTGKHYNSTGTPSAYSTGSVQHTFSSIVVTSSSIESSSISFTELPTPKPTSSALPTATGAASSSTSISATASSTASTIPFLRGVNLGGWLVLEKWMDSDVFVDDFSAAVDQYSFDSISGAESALQEHWSTYYTESDITTLAAAGINALRIPIGYWAYNNTGTPYISGADAYLEKAIGWARSAGMYVWVDCHGSPGSQNGFDNSGHAGDVDWQDDANLDTSIAVLKTMAKKYGAQEYADVVVGLEMANEPISYGNNKFSVTQSWAQEAYDAVKAEVDNENLVIVMHDAFQGADAWTSVAQTVMSSSSKRSASGQKTFGIDSHLYQLYTDSYNALDQAQHITAACGWADDLASANEIMPTYVGEFSANTNICVNPDGTTLAGSTCTESGCQCQSNVNFDDWSDAMIEQVRKYVEAQLDTFESSSSGYFMWSAKGPGGWGFLNGIDNGSIPNPVTSRKYAAQCGNSQKRREVRGSLGRTAEAF